MSASSWGRLMGVPAERGAALGLLLLGALLAASACSRETEPRPTGERSPAASAAAFRSRPADASLLGAERCIECHAELVESYRASAMARALGPIEPGELDSLPEVQIPGGLYRYRFIPTPPASPFPAAILETHATRSQHELPVPLSFAIGAGVQDRAFVARLGQSQRFAPLEVQSADDARRPEPAPGHSISPGLRFSQGITPECLGCHTHALPPLSSPLDLAPEPGHWQPVGIGCAACHGDGEAHADAQEAELYGEAAPASTAAFAAPSALSRRERLSICAACHLQGDARILFDHKNLGVPPPGGDLCAQRAVFVAREPTQAIGFVSQVQRLVLSKCFSASQMVCETCHAPHAELSTPEEKLRTRAACNLCHAETLPPGGAAAKHSAQAEHSAGNSPTALNPNSAPATSAPRSTAPVFGLTPAGPCSLPLDRRAARDCAACHLRETAVFDVDHVRIHDHWIRRDPGAPSAPLQRLRVLESPSGDWKLFGWPGDPPAPWSDDPGLLLLAREGAGLLGQDANAVDIQFGPRARSLANAWHVHASLAERSGRLDLAESRYRQALQLDPDFAPSAINLGLLLGQNNRPAEGLELLNAVLARQPRCAPAYRNRAVLLFAAGQAESAAADLERAMSIAPDPNVARALAEHYHKRSDLTRAALLQAQAELLEGP